MPQNKARAAYKNTEGMNKFNDKVHEGKKQNNTEPTWTKNHKKNDRNYKNTTQRWRYCEQYMFLLRLTMFIVAVD